MKAIDRFSEADEEDGGAQASAPSHGTAAPAPNEGGSDIADEDNERRMPSRHSRRAGLASQGVRRRNYRPSHLLPGRILLKEPDATEYATLLDNDETSDQTLLDWLHERGYSTEYDAPQRPRGKFREQLHSLRTASEMAHAFATMAREFGVGAMTDASMACAEQALMQQMMRVVQDEPSHAVFSAKQWSELNKAIGEGISNRRHIEQMTHAFTKAKRQVAQVVEDATAGAADGKAVVDKVREILGIPAGDEEEEEAGRSEGGTVE